MNTDIQGKVAKLIVLEEILKNRELLFSRQKGNIGTQRSDAWKNITKLAYDQKIINNDSVESFKQSKYRAWVNGFMVCNKKYST